MYQLVVDSFISYVKRRLDVESDEELAIKADLTKSTIASWRRRGSIPERSIHDLLALVHSDSFAFAYEYTANRIASSPAGDRIMLLAAMEVAREAAGKESAEWATWLASNKHRLFAALAEHSDRPERTLVFSDDHIQARVMDVLLQVTAKPESLAYLVRKLREDDAKEYL